MTTPAFHKLATVAARHATKPVDVGLISDANSMAFDMRGPSPRKDEAIRLPVVAATEAERQLRHLAKYLLLSRELPNALENGGSVLVMIERVRVMCDTIEDQLNARDEDRFDAQDRKAGAA